MKCRQCGAIVEQTQGKKAKLYCSDTCRKRYKRAEAYTDRIKSGQIQTGKSGQLGIEALPADVQASIDITCRYRKAAGLPDDRNERIQRALNYQRLFPDQPMHPGRIHYGPEKPGEQGYPQHLYNGTCETCGATTQIKAISKCHKCVEAA